MDSSLITNFNFPLNFQPITPTPTSPTMISTSSSIGIIIETDLPVIRIQNIVIMTLYQPYDLDVSIQSVDILIDKRFQIILTKWGKVKKKYIITSCIHKASNKMIQMRIFFSSQIHRMLQHQHWMVKEKHKIRSCRDEDALMDV